MRGHWALGLVLGLLIVGCGRAYRVVDEPIVGGSQEWTQEDVRREIRRALVNRNWIIRKDEPGVLEASMDRGRATVRVEIRYEDRSYGIEPIERRHVSVQKMNQWIRNLQKSIRRNLGARFTPGERKDAPEDEGD